MICAGLVFSPGPIARGLPFLLYWNALHVKLQFNRNAALALADGSLWLSSRPQTNPSTNCFQYLILCFWSSCCKSDNHATTVPSNQIGEFFLAAMEPKYTLDEALGWDFRLFCRQQDKYLNCKRDRCNNNRAKLMQNCGLINTRSSSILVTVHTSALEMTKQLLSAISRLVGNFVGLSV